MGFPSRVRDSRHPTARQLSYLAGLYALVGRVAPNTDKCSRSDVSHLIEEALEGRLQRTGRIPQCWMVEDSDG